MFSPPDFRNIKTQTIVDIRPMVNHDPFFFADSNDHEDWLNQVEEDILEPELPFIDAHHHLWLRSGQPYLASEYFKDTCTGHKVIASVFAECHSMYRRHGPEDSKPVGESEFVSGIGAMSDSGAFGDTRICEAMFGAVNLMLGDKVGAILEAHEIASGGRFRGVRVAANHYPGFYSSVDDPNYLKQSSVLSAIACLAERGHSLDCWVYHTQLDQIAELAMSFPDLTIILNHFGVPILGGPFRGKTEEVFNDWRAQIVKVAQYQNVVLKLGALPIRREKRNLPPTSDEIFASWRNWTEVAIDSFAPDRCMFESNFPVDKRHCSYAVLVNAFKKLSSGYSNVEKSDLFAGTAQRAYRI